MGRIYEKTIGFEGLIRTIFSNYTRDERKKLLFNPASAGKDHSLKEYYFRMANSRMSR